MDINRQSLLEALTRLQPLAQNKTTPILSGVCITSSDGSVSLTTTNLQSTMSVCLPADTSQFQGAVLDAKQLLGMVKAGTADDVVMAQTGSTVAIATGRGKYRMQSMGPVEDFPVAPAVEPTYKLHTIDGDLHKALRAVLPCAAVEDVRYYLKGVHIAATEECVTLESSDGHTLARDRITAPSEDLAKLGAGADLILPPDVAQTIIKSGATDIVLGVGDGHVKAELGYYTLISQTIAGRFPDADRVIPKDPPNRLTVSRDDLLQGLNAVSMLSNTNDAIVLAIGDGALVIRRHDQTGQDAEVEIPYDSDGKPEPMEIGLNAGYLRRIVSAVVGEHVMIGYTNPDTAILIEPETYVLMPMRI